jgi:hypothetical protein
LSREKEKKSNASEGVKKSPEGVYCPFLTYVKWFSGPRKSLVAQFRRYNFEGDFEYQFFHNFSVSGELEIRQGS